MHLGPLWKTARFSHTGSFQPAVPGRLMTLLLCIQKTQKHISDVCIGFRYRVAGDLLVNSLYVNTCKLIINKDCFFFFLSYLNFDIITHQ